MEKPAAATTKAARLVAGLVHCPGAEAASFRARVVSIFEPLGEGVSGSKSLSFRVCFFHPSRWLRRLAYARQGTHRFVAHLEGATNANTSLLTEMASRLID